MDTSEKRFERDIESFLISPKGGYAQFKGQNAIGNWVVARHHDVSRCIYLDVLCEFIKNTQPKEWDKYVKYYGDNAPEKLYTRLEKSITEQGLISVLREGIEDMGVKLKICYFKSESNLNLDLVKKYNANILGCSRQFHYTPDNNNSIDMVLSINGIPVVALELKDQLKGQSYVNAIRQFREDRSSKEFCFRLNHRFLVYFAVDLYEVWMTTQLKDKATFFMPFNQGSNGPGMPGGAGNPKYDAGYQTHYLWEDVLQRDSLLDIIHRFISYNPKEKKLLFPRYHQYDVVRKIIADVKDKGAGINYLIEHSAGSGKSNSIAWLAYRLASLHNEDNEQIFNSVIIVTNRIVLDSQLQDTINSFEHVPGLLECIDDSKHSKNLAEALNNKKRIIICTIQKFLFAYSEIDKIKGRKFAIIVDEAHQGQSGESAKTLKKALIDLGVAIKNYAEIEGVDEDEVDLNDDFIAAVLGQGKHKNQSFFAFTATPKGETLEIFGTKSVDAEGKTVHRPFHVYSMRQAIEEGFILNVLSSYTTIREAFRIIKVSEDNPELIEGAASRALFKYYKEHGYTIAQKTDMIMSNFLDNGRFQINGTGKAMVVADSRANAVRYYFAIKKYLKDYPDKAKGSDVMIAFSGEVSLSDIPSEKPYTEATMNLDEDGKYITTDKKFRKAFHSSQYNILVVANKYQTGFDEPLLHSMYVDKKLKGINAVQTLSRLNRTAPGKNSTFVLDFENTEEEIKESFLPYFDETVLRGDSDVNKVYDLRNKIKDYMLYNSDDVSEFITLMKKQSGKAQSDIALGQLTALLRPVISRYQALNESTQYTVRDFIRRFNGAYSYVTQLISLHDQELFEEFQYTTYLVKMLPRIKDPFIDIDDKIKLEYASLTKTFEGQIYVNEKAPEFVPIDSTKPKTQKKPKDTLQNIIDKVNERFDGKFTDGDRVIVQGIYQKFMSSDDIKKFKGYAKNNSTEMFVKSLFPDKFKDIVTACFIENNDSFQKLFNDPDFYQKVQEEMAKELYKSLRKD